MAMDDLHFQMGYRKKVEKANFLHGYDSNKDLGLNKFPKENSK